MLLSVVIPAYNEEKRLPKTLKRVQEYLWTQKYDWEVIVVNDGSKDQTAEVASRFIKSKFQSPNDKQNPNFKLINNKINRGKGAVVRQGMLAAKGDWRLFMDADGSTDISELEKLFKFAALTADRLPTTAISNQRSSVDGSRYAIIVGSRYLKADSIKIKQPLGRRIVSRLGNILTKLLLGLDLQDTQCGFKMFSVQAAEKIFPKQTIDRWGFDMEILAIARQKGFQIREVPVDWRDAEGSTVKKSAAFKTLKELLQIKWRMMRGKYK